MKSLELKRVLLLVQMWGMEFLVDKLEMALVQMLDNKMG